MLTVKQLVAIETQNLVPPLHVRDLRKKFGPGPLSLRSIIRQVGTKKTTLFVQVRDTSILRSVTNLAQLQAAWRKSAPSKATLVQFSQLLNSIGASIVYVSKNWQTVGITGTTASLAGQPFKVFDLRAGVKEVAEGVGLVGGALITVGTASGPIGWGVIAVFLGVEFAGGIIIADGLLEIFSSDPTASLPPSEPIERPDITIYGQLPPGVPEDGVIDLPALDPNFIQTFPDVPPVPPPNGVVPNGGTPPE
jgi:hypothetical protein